MVKCADCGFLAVRQFRQNMLIEVDDDYRTKGEIAQPPRDITAGHFMMPAPEFGEIPRCFVRAANLAHEADLADKDERMGRTLGESYSEAIKRVIDTNRECDGFTSWNQGFSPKEHREMLDRQRMMDREDERDKRQSWFQFRLTLATGLFILLAAFLGAWYQSTLSKVDPSVVNNYIQLPTATPQPPTPEATVTPNRPPSPSAAATNVP
jgi:hypothetical protein